MKKCWWGILPVIALLIPQWVHADETEYMVFLSSAGEQEVAVSELKKVVFQGGEMIVEKKDNTSERFALKDMNKMFFRMQSTGIEKPAEAGARLAWNAQTAEVGLPAVSSGAWATVYSLSGTVVCKERMDAAGGTLSLSHLSKGVYVVHYAGMTLKIVKP